MGPFGLYTVSSNSTWNNRPLSTNGAQPWFILENQVSDPSEIIQNNFFINTTNGPDLPRGFLTWGAQSPIPDLYGTINVIDPSSTLQPMAFRLLNSGLPSYAGSFTFGRNGQLVLTGVSRFFVKLLHPPFFNDAPVVWWQFGDGPVADPNAVEVTILMHTP
ncbi:hypothetical protein JB92DRAFT_1615368 [Gautieria morchelliformis]|nr:hypothetical protein JB92DRAFT_1615368 [Gautieria morchelliformis]